MRRNSKEKIEMINNDRMAMLDKIKSNLINGNALLYVNINIVSAAIDANEKNLNEYKSLIKAQDVIFNLIDSIALAESIDDIKAIRTKINYYVGKIRKILVKRGLSQNKLDEFEESTSLVRDNVSRYIRYLKREKNLQEIRTLNENIDNLSKEDADRFRKLIYNEMRYNKRNLASINEAEKPQAKKVSKKVENKVEIVDNKVEIVDNKSTVVDKVPVIDLSKLDNHEKKTTVRSDLAADLDALFATAKKPNEDKNKKIFDEWTKALELSDDRGQEPKKKTDLAATFVASLAQDEENRIGKFLNNTPVTIVADNVAEEDCAHSISNRIDLFEARYGIVNPIDYDHSVVGNMVKFVANIPCNIRNMKATEEMIRDYKTYYHGNDLLGFIKFNKDNNSIANSFRGIFGNLRLFSREKRCLSNHQRCVEYVTNFCKNHEVKTRAI